MATLGPQSPTTNDAGWETANNSAHADGGGYASTTIDGDLVQYYGYDFSSIPTGSVIAGITLRLDAFKIETAGDGDMTFTASLSWNSGSSWTSTKTTVDVTDTEATYTLGGSADTWGRSWTVAELANFRVRIEADGIVTDFPTWALDWAAVSITYTFALSLSEGSAFGMTDVGITSKAGDLALRDYFRMIDGGLASGGTSGGSNVTGGAADGLAGGGPDFVGASESFAKRETMGITLNLPTAAGVSTFDISDAVAAQAQGNLTGSPGSFQPGILEWGDMTFEGVFGVEYETPGLVVRFRNSTLADRGPAAAGIVDLATYMQTAWVLGGVAQVSIFVEDGGGVWYNKLIFTGKIEEIVVREDYIELRAFQVLNDEALVPTRVIDDAFFVWGDAEGKRPEGFMGSPVPIFYGRFGATAVKEYPPGTQFAHDRIGDSYSGEAQTSSEYKRWALSVYYPMIHGIKIPMLTMPLGTDMNRGVAQDFPALWDKIKQAFFVFGDRDAPAIQMNERCEPGRFEVQPHENWNGGEFLKHVMACTWDEKRGRGNLFIIDNSNDLPPDPLRNRSGCGDAKKVRPSGMSLTGGAKDVYGFFVNRGNPDWGTTEQQKWSGLLQMAAFSFTSLSQIRRTTASLAYGTTAGVVNPQNALDPDPLTYAEVPVGQVLSLQGPETAEPLGEIVQVRLGFLPHHGGTATSFSVDARWSWQHAMTLSAYQGGSAPTSAGAHYWTIKPRYTPLVQEPGATNSPAATGWAEDWRFVHYSQNPDNSAIIQAYPMDVRITATGGTLRVAHVWLEVIYKPARINPSVKFTPLYYHGLIGYAGYTAGIPYEQLTPFSQAAARGEIPGVPQLMPTGGIYQKTETTLGRPSVVMIGGLGPRDTFDMRYTDIINGIIENPIDIAGHLIEKYLGVGAFQGRAVDTSFGSFFRARDALNNLIPESSSTYFGWKLSMVISDRVTFRSLLARIGSQSCTLFQEQTSGAASQWRAFVDEPDPASTAPERMYRAPTGPGAGYGFRWDHIVPDSFEVRLTDRASLCTDFVLRYGGGAYEKFVRPTSHNFELNGAAYQTAVDNTRQRFQVSRSIEIEAPDVWNHQTAEALLKWHVDSRRTRRVLVEFDTFGQAVDLQPGHVIKFSDDIGQRIGYPGMRSGASWSSHQFNVLNVRISKDAGQPITVHVVAIECYERAA